VGLIKGFKDLKKTTEAAPGMISQAQQMAAQAQEMQAAQQAAAQQQAAGAQQAMPPGQPAAVPGQASGPDFEPIASVSLEQYAKISRGLADYRYDQSKTPEVAASKGVGPDSWDQAMAGWNERMTRNPAVAQEFNRMYTGR